MTALTIGAGPRWRFESIDNAVEVFLRQNNADHPEISDIFHNRLNGLWAMLIGLV
jgi:hypothetical protein